MKKTSRRFQTLICLFAVSWFGFLTLSHAQPVITSVSPLSAAPGSTVTISGANFSTQASNNIVFFGAVRATVNGATSNSLTATLPSGATYGPVTVSVGGLVAYSRQAFQPTFSGSSSNFTASSLAPRFDLTGGDGAHRSAIADLDGDGKPDLAVADVYGHTISLFRNLSSPGSLSVTSFTSRVELTAEGGASDNPYGFITGDVDGDGKPDLIACDRLGNHISVYRNVATPGSLTPSSFAPRVNFSVGTDPRYARVADLDGDGRPDIISCNFAANTISILRNIGTAGVLDTNSFAPAVDLPAGTGPYDVVIADLDGDGKLDFAVVNTDEQTLSLYRNIGIGTGITSNSFAPRVDLPALDGNDTITAGDIDGDGKLDLIFGSFRSGTISVYRNQATPGSLSTSSFAPRVDFATENWTHTVALGDLNGDGRPDIAVVGELDSRLSLFQNTSTPGTFNTSSLGARADYGTGWNAWGVSVGDLDGDGRPDVVFCNAYDDTVSIYQNLSYISNSPPVNCAPAPFGLVSWWKAEGNALDSADGNNGTLVNGATFAAGKVGQAFSFDGVNDHVRIPDQPNLRMTNALSIEAWVYPTNIGSFHEIVSKWDAVVGPDQRSYTTSIYPDGRCYLGASPNGTDSGSAAVFSANPLPVNQWTHMVGTYDGTTLKMYLNGVLDNQLTYTSGIFPGTNALTIGGVSGGGAPGQVISPFAGLIDEASIYNRALSASEVAALYNAGTNGKCGSGGGPTPPTILTQPTNVTASVGDTVSFNVTATSSLPLGFRWLLNGSDLGASSHYSLSVGANNSSLTISDVQLNLAGTYSVIVSNSVGSVISSNAVLTVNVTPPTNGCVPLPSGVVSWWKAENNALDSGDGNNGTLVNGATFAAGKVGQAFKFDGVDDYVRVPQAPNLNVGNQVTIEFWMMADSNNAMNTYQGLVTSDFYAVEIANGFSAGPLGVDFFISTDGGASVSPSSFPDTATANGGGAVISVGQWHHVAGTYDGTKLQLYIDGQPWGNPVSHTGAISPMLANSFVTIGAEDGRTTWPQYIGPRYFKGSIDEPTIYNRALSAAEILAIYNAGIDGKCVSSSTSNGVPVIYTVSPNSGVAGSIITITGTNFSPVAANNIVYFGAVKAPVAAASANTLVVTVPLGATYAPIDVTVNGLTAYANAPFLPTYYGTGSIDSSSLAPRIDLGTGLGPDRTAIGDLDGDGKPDVLTANVYDTTIWIYRNISSNGTLTAGSFAAPFALQSAGNVSNYQLGLALVDLDGDGRLDIVVANGSGNSVSVFKNLSSPGTLNAGSFGGRLDFQTPSGPNHIAVQDLNGDGRPDIVTANYPDNSISILQNLSTSGSLASNSFASPVTIPMSGGPAAVAISDLDGDGRPDIVTANGDVSSAAVSVLRNIGTGGILSSSSFAPRVDLPGLPSTIFVAAGDLDGDGKQDLVTASYASGQAISVFRNTSTPGNLTPSSFASRVDFAVGSWAHTVAIGDLDGDGKPDVAVASEIPDRLSVFKNTSTPGSFTSSSLAPRVDFATGYNAWGVSIGDLDGDGRPDVVLGNAYDNTVSVYHNLIPAGASCVPTPAGLLGWWKAENNALDNGTGHHDGTLLNGASFTAGEVGQSFNLDGNNQSVQIPYSPSLIASNFTVEAWVKPSTQVSDSIGQDLIFGQSFGTCQLVVRPGTSGLRVVWLFGTSHYNFYEVPSSTEIPIGQFTHLVGTWDGTTLRLYVNGALSAQSNPGVTPVDSGCPFYIGGFYSPAADSCQYVGQFFNGAIDELSYFGRALAPAEIQALYDAGSAGKCESVANDCVPPPSGLVGWWKAENNSSDALGSGNGVPVNVSYTTGVVGQAFAFDPENYPYGTYTGVRIPDLPIYALTNSMTIEGWVRPRGDSYILFWRGDNRPGTDPYTLSMQGNHTLLFQIGDENGNGVNVGTTLEYNQWYHVAATLDGASGTMSIYTNGVLAAQTITAIRPFGSLIPGDSPGIGIGNLNDGINNFPFIGDIDEISLYNRALSTGEIQLLYNAGSGGKCGSAIAPSIITQPSDVTVQAGSSATFAVVATGTEPFSYQWYHGTTPVGGGTGSSLVINPVQPGDAGTYSVVVSNLSGSITSSNAQLTVIVLPPTITVQPLSRTVYVGSNVTFTVTATGTQPLYYQWQFNGSNLLGKTSSSLVLPNVQLGNSGNYSVIVSNLADTVVSSNALLTVKLPPPCTAPPSGLVSWWRFENSVLDNWDSNNGITPAGFVYGSGKVGQAFNVSGSRYVLVPDSLSLRMTNALTIEAWVDPTSLSGSTPHTIVAKADNTVFLPLANSLQSSYYLGTTNNGQVYFAVSPTGQTTSNKIVRTTQVLPLNQWSFVVATYDGAALRIYINGSLAVQSNYSGGIFSGAANLGIGAVPYNGTVSSWPFSGFIDEVSLYNRALSGSEIQAIYDADITGKCLVAPTITAQPLSQAIPQGEDVKFSVSVLGSRPLTYQWRFEGQNIAGATSPNLVLEKLQPNRVGFYSVVVGNSMGVVTSSSAGLKLLSPPTCTTPPTGMISWWTADGNALDSVDGNNGSLASFNQAGKINQAFNLNGTSSRVQVPNSPSLNFGSNVNFSIEAWIKAYPTNPIGVQTAFANVPIIEKRSGDGRTILADIGYSLSLYQGRLACWLGIEPKFGGFPPVPVPTNGMFISTGPDLRDGMFHHVAVSINRGATNGGVLCVDGNVVLTFDPTGQKNSSLSNSSPLYIGGPAIVVSNSYFYGLIDEVTMYSRALSTSEVQAIASAGAAGKCRQGPIILTQPVGQQVKISSNATFNVIATGTPNLRYQWLKSGGTILGATNSIFTLTNIQSSAAGSYSVRVTNGFGSVLSSNAVLVVLPASIPPLSSPLLLQLVSDQMHLQFTGATGQQYLIEASTNLIDWQVIGAATDLGDGNFEYLDPDWGTHDACFYRIVLP